MNAPSVAEFLLQFGGLPLPRGPLGSLLVALVVIALVLVVGRFVLQVAWRLVTIAIVVVGLLWLLSVLVPGLL
jgi:hypothetical protein